MSTYLDRSNAIREVRSRFDELQRGGVAELRRCRTAYELSLSGLYWRVGGALAQEQSHLTHVVLHFPLAPQRTRESFSFGRFLRRQFGDGSGATLRFRRLLDSRDRDELDHRLRGVLRLACRDGAPLDWGPLGVDILWFFAPSGLVRRRWAQDFYAPESATIQPSATI
jgi:CRISPR type I-E-associated protein CasB/Cse2